MATAAAAPKGLRPRIDEPNFRDVIASSPADRPAPVAKSPGGGTRFYGAAVSFVLHALLLMFLAFTTLQHRRTDLAELTTIEANPLAQADLFDELGATGEKNQVMRIESQELRQVENAPLRSRKAADDKAELGEGLGAAQLRNNEAGVGQVGGQKGDGIGGGGEATDAAAAAGLGNSFLKLRAKGRRIVYVIDRSASMLEHHAVDFMKEELIKSLRDLSPTMEFQIVFYNEKAKLLQGSDKRRELIPATEFNRERAIAAVKREVAEGGTDHWAGLSKALDFHPDAIFHMTDSDTDTERDIRQLIEKIASAAKRRKDSPAPSIHVIQFWHGDSAKVTDYIREVAQRNRGSYRLILASELDQ